MRDQQGVALVTVLMVVVVSLLLGTTLIQLSTFEISQVVKQEKRVQAHYLARSGLEIGIKDLGQRLSEVESIEALELETIKGAFTDIGSYQVDFAPENSLVKITSKGTVAGRTPAEDVIVLDVQVKSSPGNVDLASAISWFQKDTGQLENTQKLRKSTPDKPLENNDRPVILDSGHKIMSDGKHYLRAPAMQFSAIVDKEFEVKNKDVIHLQTDFVSFNTKINMSGELSLKVFDSLYTEDGKKYGVVYFEDSVFTNNENKPVKGISKKTHYLFEDGTTWEDGELKKGGLVYPVPDYIIADLFNFSKIQIAGPLEIGKSLVYSSGN